MRLLLINVCGPQSFDDLYVVDGIRHSTYREAAQARSLLEHDDHWRRTISEAANIQSGQQLRSLFAVVLLFGLPDRPEILFDEFAEQMSDDLLHKRRNKNPTAVYGNQVRNEALLDINRVLMIHNKQSSDFPNMPIPSVDIQTADCDDAFHIDEVELNTRIQLLNEQQRQCFDDITATLNTTNGQMFFIDAPGGTGKTHLINVLLDNSRLHGHVCIAVASSGNYTTSHTHSFVNIHFPHNL